MNNNNNWLQSRRKFVRNISFLAGASSLPWLLNSCTDDVGEFELTTKNFDSEQYYLLSKVHDVLFPKDQFGPGAAYFKTVEYLDWVLSDVNIDEEDKSYMLTGIKWMEESAKEEFSKEFSRLDEIEIHELISRVSKQNWGESWLSRNLTYIFEAQFSDVLYGSNINGEGWKWLSHYPGYPRPTADMIYDEIFATIGSRSY
ncbi:MAG: gluconate 2-dehydrogenase subunit 3 family protein [Flavobacteriales bacterium]|nr:gluconate 2-dehydrogenase subunit 3 family protein [Flavobacteriales bacterium]